MLVRSKMFKVPEKIRFNYLLGGVNYTEIRD